MIGYLKSHPFPVEAFFERSLVLTFALPKECLRALVPTQLKLDTFNDEWAFMAIAMVQARSLRPKGFPKFLGNNFFLIGYRVFVRYENLQGKNLRGLFILKSETDSRKMQRLGNLFTHYNYTTIDIEIESHGSIETIKSDSSRFEISVNKEESELVLPSSSPFDTWKEARRFAGPLPFTFTCDDREKTVLIIEGVRNHWKPAPTEVVDYNLEFLERSEFRSARLASAFQVKNVPYYWKKGRIEKWH